MNLTKAHEKELYNSGDLSLVQAVYTLNGDFYARGEYLKGDSSVIVIIENERNEIAFYKQFSTTTGTDDASLLTTEIYREGFTPVQTALELADDGFGITLKNPTLLTPLPLHFSENTDENFYVVYGRCSEFNEEEQGNELFWIHEQNAFIRIDHQLRKATPFALEHDGACLNAISLTALLIFKNMYNL